MTKMRGGDLLIVGLLSCVLGTGCRPPVAKAKQTEIDRVRYTQPSELVVTDFEDFIGHTDPVFAVEVRARVNGYLDKVLFENGAEVEKGTPLFEIDARPYQATFDQAVASIEQGQARLIRTTADHRRADRLLERNAIGQEEYDRIQGDYAESKAAIGSLKASYDMAKLSLDWTKVSAPIAGRLSDRKVNIGNLVQADTTLLTTIVSLDPMYVTFDVDERTLLKLRHLVMSGQIKSRAEGEIPVFVGLSDEVSKNGDPLFPHQGTINFSDNRLDASTGTLRLQAIIDNPKSEKNNTRLLSPGLFIRVRLPVGDPHKSIMISERAIQTDQGRKSVFVVEKRMVKEKDPETNKEVEKLRDVALRRDIEVGTLINGLRVVEKGLKLDEKVIVDGLQRVRDRKPVELINDSEKTAESKSIKAMTSTTPAAKPQPTIAVSDSRPVATVPATPTPSPGK